MRPRVLLQSLKDSLERESSLDFQDVSMTIQSDDRFAKATVAKFVDGKWQLFEILVRPLGVSEELNIGA